MEKQKISVLYVEDEDILRETTLNMLKHIVETVHSADDGTTGLEAYKEHKPDLVITDQTMRKMNGDEMMKEILKINSEVKFMFTSAHSNLMDTIDIEPVSIHLKPIKIKDVYLDIAKIAEEIN